MSQDVSSQREINRDGCAGRRVTFFDELRGAVIISMTAFHAMYDLVYLYGLDIPWFSYYPIQEYWRISISWVFLALAGWMTAHSHNNFRRACIYGLFACGIWVATMLAAVDVPISFGIIFCMAGSTILWCGIEHLPSKLLDRHPIALSVGLVALFLITYTVPRHRYSIEGLAWLGFPDKGFSSGDYYPLIPFSLLYTASAVLARSWQNHSHAYPDWMYRQHAPMLAWMGRHSLVIYAAHQVLLLMIFELVFQ